MWRYLRDLESIIGVDLSVDEDGIVQINSPIPDDLSATAQQLLDIIQNPFTLVDVEATSGRDDVFIGRFLGGGRQIIDYGDIDLVTGGNGYSARSIITHETIEANSGLQNGVPLGSILNQRDHRAGINAENEIRSQENLPLRVLGTDRPENKPFSSITTYRTQFGEYEQIITVEETTDGFGPRAKRTGSKIIKSEVVFLGDPPSSCNR